MIFFLATKIDLRGQDLDTISTSEGRKLRNKIKAAKYMECSAFKQEGLNEIFMEAVRSVARPSRKRRICSTCTLM